MGTPCTLSSHAKCEASQDCPSKLFSSRCRVALITSNSHVSDMLKLKFKATAQIITCRHLQCVGLNLGVLP